MYIFIFLPLLVFISYHVYSKISEMLRKIRSHSKATNQQQDTDHKQTTTDPLTDPPPRDQLLTTNHQPTNSPTTD